MKTPRLPVAQHLTSQLAFHTFCRNVAIESLDELAAAIARARLAVARQSAIEQVDLREPAELAIKALGCLESTRRYMTNPLSLGEPLQDDGYDRGIELQLVVAGGSQC